MAVTTQLFSKLLAPGLRKVFQDKFKDWEEEYSKVMNVDSSKRAFEEEYTVAGLGRFERKTQGKPITYDDPLPGYYKKYTHLSWGLGFRVTREMWQDDLYSVMKKLAASLARSARQTIELEVAAMLDDAKTGVVYSGADGKSLLATDHPLLVGGTYANTAATGSDLGLGALRSASQRMEQIVSDRGIPEHVGRGKLIVVTPEYQWIADELIGTTGKPYTADNTKNTFSGMGLSYTVNHFLSTPSLWLLLGDKSYHDLHYFWRQQPIFENADDFDTKDAKFSGFMRFSLGWTDWRGVDGSSL